MAIERDICSSSSLTGRWPSLDRAHLERAGVYASKQPPDPERAKEQEEKARAVAGGGGK